MIAFVRGVIARGDACATSMLNVAGIDVDEHRRRADARDGAGGGEERVGAGDDLVARPDAERHQRDEQRVGAGGDADGVLHPEQRRQSRCSKRLDFRAHDEALAVADARRSREHLVADGRELRLEIEQRDVHGVRTPKRPDTRRTRSEPEDMLAGMTLQRITRVDDERRPLDDSGVVEGGVVRRDHRAVVSRGHRSVRRDALERQPVIVHSAPRGGR